MVDLFPQSCKKKYINGVLWATFPFKINKWDSHSHITNLKLESRSHERDDIFILKFKMLIFKVAVYYFTIVVSLILTYKSELSIHGELGEHFIFKNNKNGFIPLNICKTVKLLLCFLTHKHCTSSSPSSGQWANPRNRKLCHVLHINIYFFI